jgi:hypothetical protein
MYGGKLAPFETADLLFVRIDADGQAVVDAHVGCDAPCVPWPSHPPKLTPGGGWGYCRGSVSMFLYDYVNEAVVERRRLPLGPYTVPDSNTRELRTWRGCTRMHGPSLPHGTTDAGARGQ